MPTPRLHFLSSAGQLSANTLAIRRRQSTLLLDMFKFFFSAFLLLVFVNTSCPSYPTALASCLVEAGGRQVAQILFVAGPELLLFSNSPKTTNQFCLLKMMHNHGGGYGVDKARLIVKFLKWKIDWKLRNMLLSQLYICVTSDICMKTNSETVAVIWRGLCIMRTRHALIFFRLLLINRSDVATCCLGSG